MRPTRNVRDSAQNSAKQIQSKAVVTTNHLVQHYFRQSPGIGKGTNMIITASCSGLYPSPFCPMYSASKRTWGRGYLDMLCPLLCSFSKLTPFYSRSRGFGALYRETLLSSWRHSGQRYLSWNIADELTRRKRMGGLSKRVLRPG